MMAKQAATLTAVLVRHYGIALTSIKEKLAHRFDFFVSLASTMMTAGLLFYLWTAIYNNATSITMPLSSLLTYICLGQVFNFSRIAWAQRRVLFRISTGITSGNVVIDLLRPVDYQALQFSESVGLFLIEMLLINLPAYLLCFLLFGINGPASTEAAVGFVISLFGAFILAFSLNFLIVILAFWTIDTYGLISMKQALLDILAGTIIPLSLLPDWLRNITLLLPFQGMAHTPLSIYIGTITGSAIWEHILIQFIWAAILLILTRLVWSKAVGRLTVQGG